MIDDRKQQKKAVVQGRAKWIYQEIKAKQSTSQTPEKFNNPLTHTQHMFSDKRPKNDISLWEPEENMLCGGHCTRAESFSPIGQ